MASCNRMFNFKRCGGITAASFLYFIFFISLSGVVRCALPPDSLKIKYDKNDPRNPDCPCHSYQKRADKEFRRAGENLKSSGSDQENLNKKNILPVIKHRRINYFRIFRITRAKSIRKRIHHRHAFFKKDIAACFKF